MVTPPAGPSSLAPPAPIRAALHRSVPEPEVLERFLFSAWTFEVAEGRKAEVLNEAAAALERLVGLGLKFERGPRGVRLFDLAEVLNFTIWAGLNSLDPLWPRINDVGRRMVLGLTTEPTWVLFRLIRTFDVTDAPVGTVLRLRLPAPIEDDSLTDLQIRPLMAPELAETFQRAPGRADVQVRRRDEPMVEVGYEATFKAWPTPRPSGGGAALSDADIELYTRPREGLVQVSAAVQSLAETLSEGAGEPWTVVRRFWDFFCDRLISGCVVRYDEVDPAAPLDWVLTRGWADCQLSSALFVGLCRARRLPSRLVSGYWLYPRMPVHHYWAETWIEGSGWTPFDLLSWGLSFGGRNPDWRYHFFGRLDPRLKTEHLPRVFNSGGFVRFPGLWRQSARIAEPGAQTSFHALQTGALIYSDRTSVTLLGDNVGVQAKAGPLEPWTVSSPKPKS